MPAGKAEPTVTEEIRAANVIEEISHFLTVK
jgi:hypothetical protein